WGFVKNLTLDLDFCKQNRLEKRRFHAASLRGSCGSPLGSTSNPKKTQGLRKRAPRISERRLTQAKSQMFCKHPVWVKQKRGLKEIKKERIWKSLDESRPSVSCGFK
ncbi:MAG: hypothetical protein WBI94_02825, partial [Candidatus Cloacimonadaceae bacterium]